MNVRMWQHPGDAAKSRALSRPMACGSSGPNDGAMAEAEFGPGRMAEPLEIARGRRAPARAVGNRSPASRCIVTSGPTHEPIDPVRYIANRSSGKQGHAIAKAAAAAGAA